MTKWLPSLLPMLAAIGVAAAPLAQTFISTHPRLSAAIAVAYAILTHLMPSPLQSPKGK